MTSDRKERLRAYLRAWKKKKKAADVEAGLATPIPESKARRRTCRECGAPVEINSYWHCSLHNWLTAQSEDGIYSSSVSTDAFD